MGLRSPLNNIINGADHNSEPKETETHHGKSQTIETDTYSFSSVKHLMTAPIPLTRNAFNSTPARTFQHENFLLCIMEISFLFLVFSFLNIFGF